FRVQAIRGSSTRGGDAALRDVIRTVRNGRSFAITPDGPKGPPRKMKDGAVFAARVTGVPIVPVTFAASRQKRARTWDRMIVPQLRSMAEELGLGATFSGSDLMRIPDLLQVEPVDSEIREEERDALASLVRDAFTQLVGMRKKEGETLHADIALRVATIRQLQQRLAERRDEIRGELLASYQQRVGDIAAQAGV